MINYRNIFKSLVAAVAASVMIASCDKPYELDIPLAVSTRDIQLTKAAGSTHVLVYSTGDWTASFTDKVDWASLDRLSGSGNSEFVFSYSENYGIARRVGIVLKTSEAVDTVFMTQAGALAEPSYNFEKGAITLIKAGSSVKLPVSTNILYGLDPMDVEILYSDPDDQWISDLKVGAKHLSFNVSENNTGAPRIAYLTFTMEKFATKADLAINTSLAITQTCDAAALTLSETSGSYAGSAGSIEVSTTVNNIWPYADKCSFEITGDNVDEGWIYGTKLTSEALCFSLKENETELPRKAVIKMTYNGDSGETLSVSYNVSQALSPKPISFEEVRALAPGKMTKKQYIEGFIVSDWNSLNICQSPQTAQFNYDFTENGRTAYMESVDGKYGFCLKFDSAETAKIDRYSRVRIMVDGLTLVKESNPDRYTIKGISSDSILGVDYPNQTAVPMKIKGIKDINDNDIFTLVSVTGLEIVYKDGCFTNCTDGYSLKCEANPYSGISNGARWDVAPLMMTDKDGNTINMLTECSVPWRRNGKDLAWNSIVPQGCGTFNGIVVSETLVRYGDVGKYQLRAMEKADIDLNGPAFSKTIVEWNWNDRKNDLIPEIGEGTLSNCGTTAAASDFNNTYNGREGDGGNGGATSNQKGLVSSAAIKFTKAWWNNSTNKGDHFDITFSTEGISGTNMVFGIVWGHGAMGNTTLDSPAHWNLLYSVDGGSTFKTVDGGMITNRSVVWWTTGTQDSTPGFKEFLRKLPSECFGKSKVILRLEVADKVADDKGVNAVINDNSWVNNLGIEKGTIGTVQTSGQEIRIGTITVRYN